MASLSEFRTNRGGTLSLTYFSYSVMNPMPWAIVGFNFQLTSNPSLYQVNNRRLGTVIEIIPLYFELIYNNLPILSGHFTNYSRFLQIPGPELSANAQIPVEALSFIESQRADDVLFSVKFQFLYREIVQEARNQVIDDAPGLFQFQYKFSQKEWIDLLSKINYEEIWLIEITKPKIEEFHEVTEHIQKAYEALYNKKEPEDVLRDLRAARDSFKTFYDSKKEKIFNIIDRGSSGEPGIDKKSERIDKIFKDIGSLLNIGPHNDKYKVSYADALLAYREFISIIAYLSSLLKEVKED